jgi:hypothetical protein
MNADHFAIWPFSNFAAIISPRNIVCSEVKE